MKQSQHPKDGVFSRFCGRFINRNVSDDNADVREDGNVATISNCFSYKTKLKKIDVDVKLQIDTKQMDNNKTNNKSEKLVCMLDESPYYILKVAAQGNVDEVRRLAFEDPSRLSVRDYRGQNVVHHAVSWSRLPVLDLLETFPHVVVDSIINAQDKLGNTPLHFAIEKNQLQAAAWLLAHNANINLRNKQNQAQIHYAVELLRLDIIQLIVKKSPYAVNLPGDLGATPLHIAAAKDSPSIARLLLEEGADLLRRDENGCPPIHSATKHGSANVIDVLIEYAEKRGISRKALIHTPDIGHNLPLHAATNSGDIQAVRVCLQAGADIDAQQVNDRQTAVHYAAAQGGYEMLKLMLEAQPDKREACVHCRDILEQTPLHKAAMFNHVEVVEQLINEGASFNAQDAERRTPLLLAAAKNASQVVNCLLKIRANVNLRDKDNRNFLHIMILNGSKLKEIDLSLIKNLKQLLNERDDFGCTPIHYASKTGQLGTIRRLLELGANVTVKDHEKRNPLHLAAKYGRIQTCQKLLASENGPLLINETDGDGRTPLHIASRFGHPKVIALLVQNGALMNTDLMHNTPLNLAAAYGHNEAVAMLVGLSPHLLDSSNKQQNTALHLAARNGHALVVDYLMTSNAAFTLNTDGATFFDLAISKFQSDVASAIINHPRCEEAMNLPSTFGTPLIGLIQHLPKMALLVLDKCLTYSADNKRSPNFHIRYDFRCLQTDSLNEQQKIISLLPMNTMVKYNRVDCLAHPVCVTFLKQKWDTFGSMIYNCIIGIYMLFVALLTSVALEIDTAVTVDNPPPITADSHHAITEISNNVINYYDNATLCQKATLGGGAGNSTFQEICQQSFSLHTNLSMKTISNDLFIRMLLVVGFCGINVMIQFGAIIQQNVAYFLDFSHYLEWILYLSTLVAVLPFFADEDTLDVRCQITCAAISLLLGWVILLLYMQRFEFFGLYVIMFIEIFKTLMRALFVFSFIIVAFGLSFHMVFRTTNGPTQEFKSSFVSMMSTFSMMVGEANYVHIITPTLDGRRQLIYGDLTYVFFIAFLVLVPTLLMNMLVGLAVGDIESVQKNARLKRLAMQVEYFTRLEQKLPKIFKRRCVITNYVYYPNRSKYEIFDKIRTLLRLKDQDFELDGSDLGELDGNKTELTYVLEEMAHQSRQINSLSAKLDSQQELLKAMIRRYDDNNNNNNNNNQQRAMLTSTLDDDGNDDEDDDDDEEEEQLSGDDLERQKDNEFLSAGSRSHWHVISARFAAIKKPKANNSQIWHYSNISQQQASKTPSSRFNKTNTLESASSMSICE